MAAQRVAGVQARISSSGGAAGRNKQAYSEYVRNVVQRSRKYAAAKYAVRMALSKKIRCEKIRPNKFWDMSLRWANGPIRVGTWYSVLGTMVCVLLCFVDPILGKLRSRCHSLNQGTCGGRIPRTAP